MYPVTDKGNAQRFVSQWKNQLCFCPAYGWMRFALGRWTTCDDSVQYMVKTAESIVPEAAEMEDGPLKDRLLKWALESQSASRIKGALSLAQTMPGMFVPAEEFDLKPWLLVVNNGVLNLRSMVLSEWDPELYLTQRAACSYVPKAECPLFEKFLYEVCEGDVQLIYTLQRIAGYALTGEISEHALFVLFGAGRNGKTTFLNILLNMIGDYGTTLADSAFSNVGLGSATPELAALVGKRLAVGSEAFFARGMNESLVKRATGGDRIHARRLYASPFEFKPQFKIIIAVNEKPRIRGTDRGVWSRLKMIPFSAVIQNDKMDPELGDKICDKELSGVLRWALEGLYAFVQHGKRIEYCQTVLDEIEEYHKTEDIFGQFCEECIVKKEMEFLPFRHLYPVVIRWFENLKMKPFSPRIVGMKMAERYWKSSVKRYGDTTLRGWKGVALTPDAQASRQSRADFWDH